MSAKTLVKFVEGFEAMLETNGASHYFDVSETFDGAAWLCGGLGKAYLDACAALQLEPIAQMGGKRTLGVFHSEGWQMVELIDTCKTCGGVGSFCVCAGNRDDERQAALRDMAED